MIKNTLILLFLLYSIGFAQQHTIKGKVCDAVTGAPLSFANIRVAGTTLGTSANLNGEFELKTNDQNVKLIASYIGYYSDSISVKLQNLTTIINFNLQNTEIKLQEVIITPGINPALEIVRKAIDKKKTRNGLLKNYEAEAYTKGLIRTTEDISAGNNSIGVGLGGSDTTELKITGILENHSKNYFEQPDEFKSIILARKQSANFPPSINTLTGGRLLQNFYENNVNFLGKDLPGPISDNALNYYYYRIENITSQNDKKIYNIHIEPDNSSDPGFMGNIFITDSTFDLIKIDLILNRTANTGGLFDTVNIYQQFDYYDGIVMPVDYRLFVKANVLGLVRFGFELNTIMFNYNINKEFDKNIFNKAIVTVLPEADNVDSTYWKSTQTIPNTDEEQIAYNRIDSLENIPRKFLDDFSFFSTRLSLSKSISLSAPIGMYHFSRVEGNALDFGIFANDAFDKRLNSSLRLSYGFSDKKFKQDFSSNYLFGDYRTWEVKLNAFNNIKALYDESDKYGELFSTLVTLISKTEFRDYYYSKGFGFEVKGEVFPIIKMRLGFNNKTDNSAIVNSNFSFFNKEKKYKNNPAIFESRINTIEVGFDIDFRDYIEDGYYRRRTSLGKSYVLFSGDISRSDKNLFNSDLNFTTYSFKTSLFLKTFKSASLNAVLFTRYTVGTTAIQDMYSLPGNIDVAFNSQTFRTLNLNEVLGDRVATLNVAFNFRDEIFRMLNVPGLKHWEVMLTLLFNAAMADVTNESASLLKNDLKLFKRPFYEAGIGIGQGLLPFEIEFMWKLNYRDGNNFRIGLILPLL